MSLLVYRAEIRSGHDFHRSLSSEFGRLLHEPAAGKRDEPTQRPELSPFLGRLQTSQFLPWIWTRSCSNSSIYARARRIGFQTPAPLGSFEGQPASLAPPSILSAFRVGEKAWGQTRALCIDAAGNNDLRPRPLSIVRR
jgi:hypothetical protein